MINRDTIQSKRFGAANFQTKEYILGMLKTLPHTPKCGVVCFFCSSTFEVVTTCLALSGPVGYNKIGSWESYCPECGGLVPVDLEDTGKDNLS